MPLTDAQGVQFKPVTILHDDEFCTECGRRIRVREVAAYYDVNKQRCRDCVYAEPINEHNRTWRKDARDNHRAGTPG